MRKEKIVCDCCGKDISLVERRIFYIQRKFVICKITVFEQCTRKDTLDVCNECYDEWKKWIAEQKGTEND